MKKKSVLKLVLISLALLLGLAIFGCQTAPADPEMVYTADFTLRVIETTDVHGSLFPFDFIRAKEAPTSLAQVYTYVKAERGIQGQKVLLLDGGDILQGQPVVYYSNFEATAKPHSTSLVMNYMGYEVGVVGNHDVEAGHDVYDKLIDQYNFPWLAANIVRAGTDEPYFEPYTIIWKGGAKIAVLGLCTPGVPTWLPEDLWEGMEFQGMVDAASKWVPVILEKENPDIMIGLFHAGTDFTYNRYTEDDPMNPNASELVAKNVAGFDVIFVGHDHAGHNYTVKDPAGQEVLILGGLNAAKTAAVANIELIFDKKTGKWNKKIAGEIVEIEELAADPAFTAEFAPLVQEVKDYVSKPIGTFTKTITTRDSMFGDSPFVALIHSIQLELTDADVSFVAPLSSDAQIKEGKVFVRDMFQLYKYENLLYTMKLTGKEIADFLEYSYANWFNIMSSYDDHIINFKKDKEGKMIWNERYSSYDTVTRYYNYDSAAGINYTVDLSKPAGSKVEISGFSDGRAFEPEREYLVAINSYRASGGGGHLTKGAGLSKEQIAAKMVSSTIKDLRYYLMKWIEKQGTVAPKAMGNWTVVPSDWWQQAKTLDYQVLYEGRR